MKAAVLYELNAPVQVEDVDLGQSQGGRGGAQRGGDVGRLSWRLG